MKTTSSPIAGTTGALRALRPGQMAWFSAPRGWTVSKLAMSVSQLARQLRAVSRPGFNHSRYSVASCRETREVCVIRLR